MLTALLILLGLLAMLVGLISLIWPIRRLGIQSRRTAAWVFASGLLMWIIAGATAPDSQPPSATAPTPAVEQATGPTEGEVDDEPPTEPGSTEAVQQVATPPSPGESPPEAAEAQTPPEESEQEPELPSGITQVTVTNVVDGDTIDVEYAAGAGLPDSRIRLIGVDTPEVHGRTEPYGPEASAFTKEQLTGKTVWLEKDVSETDRYGRALRYVWLIEPPDEPTEDDIRKHMFNALLVLGGYAQVSTYPPDVRHADLFTKFQREAREAEKGLWGLAPNAEETPTPSEAQPTSNNGGSAAPGSNQGQDQSPSHSRNCDPSYPDVCIPPPPPDLDCKDVPYRNFRVLRPDPHRFDGDRDGIGCES